MGRESRFLLALLGLLASVFFAALSIRLLSPRPPKGAGPDIHAIAASPDSTPLVPPPVLTPRPRPESLRSDQPEPAVEARFQQLAPVDPPTLKPPVVPHGSQAGSVNVPARFSAPKTSTRLVSNEQPVATAAPSWQAADRGLLRPAQPLAPASLQPPSPQPPARSTESSTVPRAVESPPIPPQSAAPPGPSAVIPGQPYKVVADDCWWSIAERAYGDGRYYRSLFAWNRALDPRISLAAGTTLEIPPPARLQLAWPRLVPAE